MFLGIDQSKRSTAAVLLNPDGSLRDFTLICLADEDEKLILSQWFVFDNWMDSALGERERVAGALIEGLSFGSVGSGKDFLAGLQWFFRAQFRDCYGLFLGTVPVSMWRSKVLTKEEQREAKAAGKDGLKKACVAKLPAPVFERFDKYLKENEISLRAVKKSLWKDCIYDLTDAYWIGQYRLSLHS